MKKNKTIFKESKYNIVREKENFDTVVTTTYDGNASMEIITRAITGAPTVASGLFEMVSRDPNGDKYKVKIPILNVPDNVLQDLTSDCDITPTDSQTLEYFDISLVRKGIVDRVCVDPFVKDYSGQSMPAGANNDEVPSNANEELIKLYEKIAQKGVESYIWSQWSSQIEAEANLPYGTAGCGFGSTAVAADAIDVTKVRQVLADILIEFTADKEEVDTDELILAVPRKVFNTFRLSLPALSIETAANVSLDLGAQLGVYGLFTSPAIAANKIYIMQPSNPKIATDLPSDWENVSVINLGDFTKANLNKVEYSLIYRIGAGVPKPCETGAVVLV